LTHFWHVTKQVVLPKLSSVPQMTLISQLFSFDFSLHNAKLLTFYSFGVISFFVQFLRIILPF